MRWRRHKAGSPKIDYIAAMRESGYLRDRAQSIAHEGEIAAASLDFDRLKALRAEQEVVLVRMREIAREVGAR